MSKSGFSTLNRWLGRKNKDKSMVNGKLSKSSTNLSISSTNINETSQLEYNRITPLPAATTNAPFEQTFRITVLLPKDQLYVTRLGARVPLSKLLELVCDNKLLDAEKYEFRNPVDPSQVYSCDLTIGAVGLSEVRLCHKSESYDSFNSDEIIKLHRTSLIRESLSSSEFSSRNSKHTTKTTSPYSSTNSLNSMDSSALSYGRSPKLPVTTQPKMSAPPRKKRAAPRPPSQIAIPEKSPLIMENGEHKEQHKPQTPASKDFSVSTPNLSSSTMLHSDINGNDCNGHMEDFNEVSSGNGSLNSNGYAEDTVLYAQIQKKNALNRNSQSQLEEETNGKFPEPSPRKRIVQIKKKTTAPPAPPPRNSLYQEDAVSIASTNVSSTSTPTTPVGLCKSLDSFLDQEEPMPKPLERTGADTPKPVPRITTSTTLLNATDIENDLKNFESDTEINKAKPNVSKVLLNRTPTPEPRSLSCEPPDMDHSYETHLQHFKQQRTEDDCVSKQADSGIGEPVPSPTPDIQPSSVSTLDVKSNFESSSDDDDMVKVYNFKLGKTLVKPHSETKTLEELTVMNNGAEETDSEISTPLTLTQVPTPNTLSETSSWNFAIPISPPPNFADNKFMDNLETDSKPDTPITPKIMERPILDFEELKREQEQQEIREIKEKQEERLAKTPSSPLDNIVDELSNIIQDKGLDSLIKKSEEPLEIEAAKPNTLSNFSINSIIQTNSGKPKEVLSESPQQKPLSVATNQQTTETDFVKSCSPLSSPSSTPDEEKLYRKRSSITSLKQRRSVTRSDSFHTTAGVNSNESLGLNKRTSSQLSLDQMAGNLSRRRSSSELSIGESPSLLSLEVMKTILNSRKNSLANSSGEEDKPIEVNARRPSEELKFASLELKTCKTPEKLEKEITKEVNIEEKQELKKIHQEEKPKELPKVYRYSGPPSINFSTWSERPKSQVAIKNEGDYIFGGAKAATLNNNYRLSTPASTNEPPPVAPKPATIQRMGIPEKDYKVPVMVKPLKDVVIDSVPQKEEATKPVINGDLKTTYQSQTHTLRPSMETGIRPLTQVIVNSNTNTLPRNTQRPTVESVLRPQTQTIVNTSTLPRANKQRFSTPATMQGPQILRSSSIKQTQETEKVVAKPGPQILRSSSITRQQENEKASVAANPAPFGQNTLRRTGFKEKILAKEEQEQQKAINTTTIQQKLLSNGDLKLNNQKFNNSITSAKLHLNLKKTNNSSITTITSNQGSKTASPYSSSSSTVSFVTPALKPKPLTPKTAPVQSTLTTFSLNNNSTNPPPPPPPAPAMSIQLKPVTMVKTPTESDDPRDELLSAIRNFNKQGLKKA
ncbi:uncharacterized protein LOC135957084 [Calliphora vicina]|uniref:uncharacterized protein LOC135957084 n=1 Tax=Calliphora vicina TaxID=7373 RepID=UPI00325AD137